MSSTIEGIEQSVDEPTIERVQGKDYWEIAYNRMTQDEANYQVLGGTPTQACAACRWFVSPDECTVVYGPINPGGLSDMYMAKQDIVQEPIPVQIVKATATDKKPNSSNSNTPAPAPTKTPAQVDAEAAAERRRKVKPDVANYKSSDDSILGRIKSLLGLGVSGPVDVKPDSVPTFSYVKSADGNYRFYVTASNNFEDRHIEIITKDAHREFVDWCDSQKAYPELWIWHAKGSRIGEVDWIEEDNGMLVASGPIDPGAVSLVERLKDFDHVSHGFLGVTTKEGHIVQYRAYEISLLPRQYAANFGTGASVVDQVGVNLLKEIGMAFSDTKRKILIEKTGDESLVTDWEKQTDELRSNLEGLGIEYKEVEVGGTDDISDLRKEIQAVTKAVGDLAAVMNANNKSVAEQVEEAQVARIKEAAGSVTGGYKASEEGPPPATQVTDAVKNSWFDELVMAPISNGRG